MLEVTEIFGNLGNFVGAIGVVGSLLYLVIQVRQNREATDANTRALEENRRLALAQTYQQRAAALQETALFVAGSPEMCDILVRIGDLAAPNADPAAAIAQLSPVEHRRLQAYLNAHRLRLDNLVFQYEQGFLTDEYHASGVKGPLRVFAPWWAAIGLSTQIRPGFAAAVQNAIESKA
jgi:hypothetical protein